MPSTPVVVLDSTLTDIANAIRSKTSGTATMKPGEMPAQIAAIPSGVGGGIPRAVDANGVYGVPTQSFAFSLPSNATDAADYSLFYAFNGCTALTSADLGSLTTVSGAQALNFAFNSCDNLSSIDFGSLTTVSGSSAFANAFSSCTRLTSADFSSLVTVSGPSAFTNAFSGCIRLTSADFSSLATVSGSNAFSSVFNNCYNLTSVNFSSLTTVSENRAFASAFRGCTRLTSLSFPALTASSFGSYTDQFDIMLKNVTGCTVHFPAAIQSTIGSWASVTNGFGGTNTTVLFDL